MPIEAPSSTAIPLTDEGKIDLEIARETVEELLNKMQVKARVAVQFGEADEERGRIPILIDIRGNDLGILIGRRAETLNALQYITSLILSKKLGHPVTVVVDVEGYRDRRQTQLRQLARRMAEQAVKTGRRQILEPMPANERRIIHMELRDNPKVRTESIGEDPHRKVTIIPVE
jgi:spoIIIJ-associated protein